MISFVQTGNGIVDFILTLIFLVLITYPILGGFDWFIGVLCYSFLFKYKQKNWDDIPVEVEPFVTIMVPAHNEEIVIEDTLNYLMTKINYENYEVLVTDDGSTDRTPEILKELQEKYDKLRVIRIEKK